MTVWLNYQLYFFGGPLLSFLIFFIISQIFNVNIGAIVMICGMLFSIIKSKTIVCPKCKTPLSSSNSAFSKHYRLGLVVPKKCVNCDYDLDPVVSEYQKPEK